MKTILENFLSSLGIDYTKHFAWSLFQEHPHKHNMYGLKKMLDVYGVKTLGVHVGTKDLSGLNYPCILHIHGDFVVGMACDTGTITYLQHNKTTTVCHDAFKRMWTGNALVVEETTEAVEPDYRQHLQEELISTVKTYSIPVMLILAVGVGIANNIKGTSIFDLIRVALSLTGILVCAMLVEKQLFGESLYGDRVCSMFHHADCNSVLDGPMAKIFGISWSEIGLGYFIANILLLSLYPTSSCIVAAINWAAMLYGAWSIYYQWHIAKSRCVLCVIVQVIIWAMGITTIISYVTTPFAFDIVKGLLSCTVFGISIMAAHQFALAHVAEEERVYAVQQFRALKANGSVAKTLFEKGDFYETTLDDSSITFGNPDARMRVTILSNPHCNPCARMHKQVERLLRISESEICIQYVFSSFNETLEDSSRYLIACYINSQEEAALHKFALWYAKEKFDYEKIIKKNEAYIHTQEIEKEMEKHRKWREKTSLIATPTILINGYKLPDEYELGDLAMLVSNSTTEKNIVHDINGRSTTPLGAE